MYNLPFPQQSSVSCRVLMLWLGFALLMIPWFSPLSAQTIQPAHKPSDYYETWTDSSANVRIEASDYRMLTPPYVCGNQKQKAHNNVDLIRFEGQFYVAYRTAPSHFASRKARIHIMRSENGTDWICEHSIHLDSDLREPRFLNLNGQLRLYFFQAGTNFLRFEPRHVWTLARTGAGTWGQIEDARLDGYVPWRLRMHRGRALMSAYYGQGFYAGRRCEVRLFSSEDGVHWSPISAEPQLAYKGAGESEFIFDDLGNLWGTVRLEFNGSYVIHASKDSLGCWQTKYNRNKYDSALMFRHGSDIYLVARRNVDGPFYKMAKWIPRFLRGKYSLIRYSLGAKRTALFRLNQQTHELEHLFDLPGRGDNAYAGIAEIDEDTFLLVNYSNDIHGPDLTWLRGQWKETHLYTVRLDFHNLKQPTSDK